ncbi:putative dehydrogenase/reductase SDR family member 12-like [Scophthalmus maximus]|uniref:Putative dehydrogenase/reductase SDR family member 12-like n=1 Tax=Scophthalmus maximus TaxID=52904 RepID=A0A2U9B5N0_SCOMX|nr:DHRS-12_like_SDR_c-like domain-containing protein [Scophthalmus maximus]AWO99252.1 putative dehydrogenase/reductase SDR family member 12-like [Scophthalmus maximus]
MARSCTWSVFRVKDEQRAELSATDFRSDTMSLYRNSAWFLKGMTEFTRSAFLTASKLFVEKDLEVAMAGRSFMITGANSGIGRATAMAIAKRGGTIHMVCRNKDKAEEARADIVKETGNKEVYVHILDMSETKKVGEFAEGFKRKYKALNVLINNAGSIMSQRDVNAEGLEKSFATNVLGIYILTKSLIPLLEKSADPRVITVSSGGMLVQKLRTGNLQSDRGRYDGTMVYAQHKRQQVVMTEQLAKTHTNIHFSVMHPGWVDTPAVANAMPDFHRSMKDSLRTPEQGADTAVWLAVSEAAITNPSGRFYQDRKMVSTHLPLAWTHSSPLEEQELMSLIEDLAKTFQPH